MKNEKNKKKLSIKTLKPGNPARGTQTGRPIMVLLDLLGRKQALRILWELREEALNFRVLQERCGKISPTILNKRLAEMREAGIVEHLEKQGYVLTKEGAELLLALSPLGDWAKRWQQRVQNDPSE